jgi:ABC-type branched-subunit amino acid transport system substrate-binding protein
MLALAIRLCALVALANCLTEPSTINSNRRLIVSDGDVSIGYITTVHDSSDNHLSCDVLTPKSCTLGLQPLKFALNELNRRPDILPNITVGFVALDSCGTSVGSLQASTVIANDDVLNETTTSNGFANCANSTSSRLQYQVIGVVGPSSTATSSLACSLLGVYRIPQIATYATGDTLSDKTIYEYFLRLVSSDSFQVRALLDLCQFFNWSYVSLVYSEGSYGENAASKVDQFLRDASRNYTICMATSLKLYADATTADFVNMVTSLLAYPNMRVVLVFLSGVHRITFFQIVKRIAGIGRFLWIAGDFFGFYLSSPVVDVVENGIFLDHPAVEIPDFRRHMESISPWNTEGDKWLTELYEFEEKCSLQDPLNITGNGCRRSALITPDNCPYVWSLTCRIYDAVFVLANAAHRLVTDRCPQAFKNKWLLGDCIRSAESAFLEYLHRTDMEGLIGRIRFDSRGDVQEDLIIRQVQKSAISNSYVLADIGRWSPVGNIITVFPKNLSWNVFQTTTDIGKAVASVCALPCSDNEYISMLTLSLLTRLVRAVYFPTAGVRCRLQVDAMSVLANYSMCCVTSVTTFDNEYILYGKVPCCWICLKCRENEIVVANRTGCQSCPTFHWPDNDGVSCQPITSTYLRVSHPISACLLVMAYI